MSIRLQREVRIEAPVARVYDAWTTGDAVARWFAPMAVVRPRVVWDFRVGGDYEIETDLGENHVHTTRGRFLEIAPQERIVMTWHCDAFADRPTRVIVGFRAEGAGTVVDVVHEGFDLEETRDQHAFGWEACFSGLAELIASSDDGREQQDDT